MTFQNNQIVKNTKTGKLAITHVVRDTLVSMNSVRDGKAFGATRTLSREKFEELYEKVGE